jgi:hypothetical protein
MPSVTGRVFDVYVSDGYAWARITDEGGVNTKVFIWSDAIEDYLPTQRILHGMWLAMLRDALANNLTVDAETPELDTRLVGLRVTT